MGYIVFISLIPMLFIGVATQGSGLNDNEMRDKVVVYCIEKPQLCKEEYQNIKTQNKLNTYQKPEIK